MIPEFPNFKKIELSDKPEIEKFTKRFPPYSDFNFTSLFCWDILGRRNISRLNDNLVVKMTDDLSGEDIYSFIGSNKALETIDSLLELSKEEGLKPKLRFIAKETIDALSLEKHPYVINEDRDNFDYIYSIENLCEYPGHEYAQARNLLSRFETRHGARSKVELIDLSDEKNKRYFTDLMRRWEGAQDKYIKNEGIALQRMFENIKAFNLIIVMIFIDDTSVGVSINEKIDDEYALSHFAKADYHYAGVYSYLLRATSNHLKKLGCSLLNYEEDMGLTPLRQAKESYQPVSFLKKYTIQLE